MIFVTVGTHEQPFNRLVECMDKWAESHNEKVVIQTGYSTYVPKNCEWSKLYPFVKMRTFVNDARIIITHGGPSSYIMPLQIGKVPVVVPRIKELNEHVNNHQLDFCRIVSERQGNIILVEDIEELINILDNYDSIVENLKHDISSNNEKFCSEFERLINEMVK